MRLLKKRENNNADSEEIIVKDFKLRTPYSGYRPISYRISQDFLGYQSKIDNYLKKLFCGEIDDGNGDILDNLIMDMAKQAERSLEKQHTEHKENIKNYAIRADGDRRDIEARIEMYQKQLEENLKQQEKYRQLLEQDEFIVRRKKA